MTDPSANVATTADPPEDPLARETWLHRAGHVAAYRERWRVPDANPAMLPPCDRGEQGRARTWVAPHLSQNPILQPRVDAQLQARTNRLHDRLDALRSRMAAQTQPAVQAPHIDTEPQPSPGHESSPDPDLDLGQ